MGAGRSIAVQNFNEQLSILGLGFLYTFSTSRGLGAVGAIVGFGFLVAATMWLIKRWHANNLVNHRAEVEALLEVARSDRNHHA
jgi:MFS transporter, LPLT family, lysophospholipid transporter